MNKSNGGGMEASAQVDRPHRKGLSRRHFGLLFSASAGSFAGVLMAKKLLAEPVLSAPDLMEQTLAQVLPPGGVQTRITLHDSLIQLVERGVIDPEFFLQSYEGRLPPNLRLLLSWPAHRPISLTLDNASVYVNLLWPLGLANRLSANEISPISGARLPSFASTAGWTLGKEGSGASYFNQFPVVELTAEQEELAVRVAKNTYRPCCNNSTFFQDCNHGSALFGVIQLGASQGLSEADLYREALAFNSHWFPSHYVQIALYTALVEKRDWTELGPAELMGFNYSSIARSQPKLQQLGEFPELASLLNESIVEC